VASPTNQYTKNGEAGGPNQNGPGVGSKPNTTEAQMRPRKVHGGRSKIHRTQRRSTPKRTQCANLHLYLCVFMFVNIVLWISSKLR
jgi:hypothetical protein